MKPPAIGYLRSDQSGTLQTWHETQMRSHATKLGYDYRKTIVFNHLTIDPMKRLTRIARAERVDAVLVPSLEHLEITAPADIPRGLLLAADVLSVFPPEHHTRDLSPNLDSLLNPGKEVK